MIETILYYVRQVIKFFCELSDHYIERVSLDYHADVMVEMGEIEKLPDAWKSQSYYWNSDADTPYHWDITPDVKKCGIDALGDIISQLPDNVDNLVYTIKYSYGNRSYKYISRGLGGLTWPRKSSGMKFIVPFMSVWGLDEFGNEVKEITKHFKKAAGPKGDFHGQDVKVMDVMKYDYQKVRVKYIMSSKDLREGESVLEIVS